VILLLLLLLLLLPLLCGSGERDRPLRSPTPAPSAPGIERPTAKVAPLLAGEEADRAGGGAPGLKAVRCVGSGGNKLRKTTRKVVNSKRTYSERTSKKHRERD